MPKLLKRYWFIALMAVLLAGGILNRTIGNRANSATAKKQQMYTVMRQTIKQTLTLSGAMEAEQKSTLRFQTGGRLAWVGVKLGDTVRRYQAVASLDQRDVKKNLEKKLNSYLKTRWDFEQTQDDNEGKIITDALKRILEKSQFDLNNSVLDVELQALSIEYATLMSPIEGIVTRISAPYPGVNISTPTQAEFDIVNPKTVYLQITPDQTDVTKLKADMRGEIVMDSYPDQKFTGVIGTIAFEPKTGEPSTAYETKVLLDGLDNTAYKLRIGMTGDSTFTLQEKPDVLALPSAYIKRENGKKYVWKKMGKNKEKAYIETGLESESLVEVTRGLWEGDVIYD